MDLSPYPFDNNNKEESELKSEYSDSQDSGKPSQLIIFLTVYLQ